MIDLKKIALCALLIGLSLMVVPNFRKKNHEKENDFVRKTENDLSRIISSIENAGKSSVLITLEEGEEFVYATENRKNKQEDDDNGFLKRKVSDNEKKYLTVRDSNGNENPLIIKKIEPKVRGAIVACKGFNNPKVREDIFKVISVALNISSNKICITKLKD